MADKLNSCPCCGGEVDDNCTEGYAQCWCGSCGLTLEVYGKEAKKRLIAAWNSRVASTSKVKQMANGDEKCQCGSRFPAGYQYCPNCGCRIERKDK